MENTTARTRQPYASAPLRFVAFEVQFGLAPSLATQEGRAAVYDRLREAYPVADAQMTLQLTVTPIGAPPAANADLVMTNPERTRSVTIGANALSLQTSTFVDSNQFVELISEALAAVEPVGVPAVRRVGLRFVDEIRIPDVDRADQWEPFVCADLLGPVRFAGDFAVDAAETQLMLRLDENLQGVVRFGPRNGFAVDPRGRLRLPEIEPGQFFLLDVDMAWQPAAEALFPLEVGNIVDIYWRLNEPSHVLFERAITDRAREIFREETK